MTWMRKHGGKGAAYMYMHVVHVPQMGTDTWQKKGPDNFEDCTYPALVTSAVNAVRHNSSTAMTVLISRHSIFHRLLLCMGTTFHISQAFFGNGDIKITAATEFVIEGGSLQLNCTLTRDIPGYNASDLSFGFGENILSVKHQRTLNSRTIQYFLPNAKVEAQGQYYCYLGSSHDSMDGVYINVLHLDVQCKSYNYLDLTCGWNCAENGTKNSWAMTWAVKGRHKPKSCDIHKTKGRCTCYLCGADKKLDPYGQCQNKKREFRKNHDYIIKVTSSDRKTGDSVTYTHEIFTDTCIVKTPPVRNLRVVNITKNSIRLTWRRPRGPMQFYSLQCRILYAVEYSMDYKEKTVTDRDDVILVKLHPGVKYSINVQCRPENGIYWSKSVAVMAKTLPTGSGHLPLWGIIVLVVGAILVFLSGGCIFNSRILKKYYPKFFVKLPSIVVPGRTTVSLPENDTTMDKYTIQDVQNRCTLSAVGSGSQLELEKTSLLHSLVQQQAEHKDIQMSAICDQKESSNAVDRNCFVINGFYDSGKDDTVAPKEPSALQIDTVKDEKQQSNELENTGNVPGFQNKGKCGTDVQRDREPHEMCETGGNMKEGTSGYHRFAQQPKPWDESDCTSKLDEEPVFEDDPFVFDANSPPQLSQFLPPERILRVSPHEHMDRRTSPELPVDTEEVSWHMEMSASDHSENHDSGQCSLSSSSLPQELLSQLLCDTVAVETDHTQSTRLPCKPHLSHPDYDSDQGILGNRNSVVRQPGLCDKSSFSMDASPVNPVVHSSLLCNCTDISSPALQDTSDCDMPIEGYTKMASVSLKPTICEDPYDKPKDEIPIPEINIGTRIPERGNKSILSPDTHGEVHENGCTGREYYSSLEDILANKLALQV